MFPFLEHPSIHIGSYTLLAGDALVCIAVVVGYEGIVRCAPRFGFKRAEVVWLAAWMIGLGFVSSHLFDMLAYRPDELLANPLELLRIPGSMSSFGGIFGGLAAAVVIMRRGGYTRDAILRYVDLIAFVLPFAWIFGRLGCALSHDHIGIRSDHWLAVQFPDGARFDLGLLELLYTILIAAGFALLGRRPRPSGFFPGLFFALYGPVRFGLDALRVGEARYLSWTPGQYMSVASTLLGIALLTAAARAHSGRASVTQ